MAIADLAYVKSVLEIAGTKEDVRLQHLIDAADAAVKRFAKLDFEQATRTEFYSGDGTRFLVLRQRPVQAILNLWLDDSGNFGAGSGFGTEKLLQAGVDYELRLDGDEASACESGIVLRIGTVWPNLNRISVVGKLTADIGPAFGNIKVEYTAGWNPVPADVKIGVATYVGYLRRMVPFGGNVTEETLGRWSYKLQTPTVMQNGVVLPADVASLLRPYMDVVI